MSGTCKSTYHLLAMSLEAQNADQVTLNPAKP